VVLLIGCFSFCRRYDELSNIRRGDFSIVHEGTYHGRLNLLGDGSQYQQLIQDLRGEIERNPEVLDLISERYYKIPHKPYQFKFAAVDEDSSFLILRYFARIVEHPVYAGYQVQFVHALESRRLIEVFTSEVPLE
jgi:hypothetical protein